MDKKPQTNFTFLKNKGVLYKIGDFINYIKHCFRINIIEPFDPNIKYISFNYPLPYNQGNLSSCLVNAYCSVFKYMLDRQINYNLINYDKVSKPKLSLFCKPNKIYSNTIDLEELKSFKPSRYYMYHYANVDRLCKTLKKDSDGSGSFMKYINFSIFMHGILPEQSWENNIDDQYKNFSFDPTDIGVSNEDLEIAKIWSNRIITKNINPTFSCPIKIFKQ